MAVIPRLSLCIPTINRAGLLATVLESALREAATAPEGTVEVLVSDNGSTDGTPGVVASFLARHPALRAFRFEANRDFDTNYLNCMERAQGEYVWIMGDDDAWMPGSVLRILRELEAGPDAVLCAPMECDVNLNPTGTRSWFEDPEGAPGVWRLESREDLAAYFRSLRFQAGAFAFISASVIRRSRFLANVPSFLHAAMGHHYLHVWGMLAFLLSPAVIHWVREPVFFNRTGNDPLAEQDPWARGMLDLRAWRAVGDYFLGADPVLREAFMGVLRRNHQDIMVRRMRMGAGGDPDRWALAREHLLAVGFDPRWVEASDLMYRLYTLDVSFSPRLDPSSLCVADLPHMALGARRAAVLAPGGLTGLREASPVLGALRISGRFERILVLCDPGGAALLEGFEVLEVDPLAFAGDSASQGRTLAALEAFAPGLLVNVDRARGPAGELMAARARAPAALAFQGRGQGLDEELAASLDRSYTFHLPAGSPARDLASALGLPPEEEALWPSTAARDEAMAILEGAGWEPGRTLVLCGDDPGFLEDPALPARLAAQVEAGWTVIGVGGRGSFAPLDRLLEPLGDRAMNLGGALGPPALVALADPCGAVWGGIHL